MEHTKESYKDIVTGVAIGGLTGVAEVIVNQPLIYFKNMFQQKKSISLKPQVLYRGLGVNVACMAPTTAIQFASEIMLQQVIPGGDFSEKTVRAFMAGVISALASTPTELIVLQQQNKNLSVHKTIQTLFETRSVPVLYRGITPKLLRDGIFCTGLLSLYPTVEHAIRTNIADNKIVGTVGSSLIAGGITTLISHSFDTISTLMQADYDKQSASTAYKTAVNLYQKEGFGGFFKGAVPRGTRVVLAIPLMSNVKVFLDTVTSNIKNTEQEE